MLLLFPVTFLIVSAVQRELHGLSIRSRQVGSTLGEMQRRAGSSYAMSARDLESLATAVHRPRATGELVNRTRAADGVRSARPAAQRKFSASRSQAQHFLLNGLRPTPLVDIWSPTDSPPLKNAKKFWNHFMFRRRSGFQSILPIGNNEVHQQKCHAIPFSQSVAHRGCETLVLKNHLCVGRCSAAVRVPADVRGEEGRRHALCSHCAPVTFRLRKVPLRCAGDAHVIKVVAMVEDCQCEGSEADTRTTTADPGSLAPACPETRPRGDCRCDGAGSARSEFRTEGISDATRER